MTVYGFGPFTLDVPERRLTRGKVRLSVAGKPFEILRLLVEAGGRLVPRETFSAELWPRVTVEDRNLTVHVSTLRKALSDGSDSPYIETVARVGYRISVPVELLASTTASTAIARTARFLASDIEQVKREARSLLSEVERLAVMKAFGLFERVLASQPDDANSHAGLASAYLLMASAMLRRPLPVEEAIPLARDSARRALALDENCGEAWAVLGSLKMIYERDWKGASADFERATSRDPRSIEAAIAYGQFLSATGCHREAIHSLNRARELDPLRHATLEQLGLAQWMAGDSERALATLADATAINPTARRPHFRRMVVLDQVGRYDEALAERITWLHLLGEGAFAGQLTRLVRTKGYLTAMGDWIALLERLNQWY